MLVPAQEGGTVGKRQINRSRRRMTARFGTEKLQYMGYTEDISPGGIFIQAAAVLKPGTRLQIQLKTSSGEIILLNGQVRWAKKVPPQLLRKIKAGMGILITEFLEGEDIFRSYLPEE